LDKWLPGRDGSPASLRRTAGHCPALFDHGPAQTRNIFFDPAPQFAIFMRLNNFSMKIFFLLSISLLVLSCCSTTHYVFIVRHAEKLDNTPYSVLSPEGHKRAALLREQLQDKKIDLIFATPFKRTQETADPLAKALNKAPLIYRNNAEDSIANVIKANKGKNILLVGHSGNIPSIIEKITGSKIKPVSEQEYDNLWIIEFKKQKVNLLQKKY
jgi:phosphohistidine phosphatase SixA